MGLSKKVQSIFTHILFAIVRLDLWIMVASMAAENHNDDSIFGLKEDEYVEKLLPAVEVQRWKKESYFQGHHHQEKEVREYVNGFSKEQAIQRICGTKTLGLISRTLNQVLNLYNRSRTHLRHISDTKDFGSPSRVIEHGGAGLTQTEYI